MAVNDVEGMMRPADRRARVSRREMLRTCGAVGTTLAAALLAACQPAAPAAPTAAPAPRPTTAPPQAAAATAKPSEPVKPAAPAATAESKPAAAAPTAPPKPTTAPEPPRGGTLVYALSREPDRLDPTRSGQVTSYMVSFSLHEPLLARAADNKLHPWLAESWEISQDGRAYTFKLRRDVTFHDGTPFNAQAVKYNMDRVHDPNAKSRISGAAYGIYERTETPDDYTAVIHLNTSWAPFLDNMSYMYRLVSPTAAEKWGDDLGLNPVGTGPFMFKEWVPNSHVSLVRNPDYTWGSPMFKHPGPAYLDAVTFQTITEAGTRMAALERGDVHVVENLPPQDLDRVKSDPKYKVLVGFVQGRPYGFSINMRKPPTDDLAVRQALEVGISREAIVRTVFGPYQSLGAFTAAHNVLVPITWGYDKAAEIYTYDPDKARQLLEGAGWTVGPDGIRQKDGQRLEVVLGTWENGIVEVMQAQLREVGIDLKIQVAPVLPTNEAARREQVHMSPLPSSRTDPDVLITNHSRFRTSGNEFTFHTNSRFDELLDQGASATNDEERLKIYSEVQKIMMQDAMYLPVFHRDNVSGARAEVNDLIFERGAFPLLNDTYLAR